MRIAYGDLIGGVSGDMFVAALLDLGLPLKKLGSRIKKNPDAQIRASFGKKIRPRDPRHAIQGHLPGKGIAALVETDPRPDQTRQTQRRRSKQRASHIFTRLAEAEAKIHGGAVDDVHFHEVGATDSIVDIMAAAIGVHELGIESFAFSRIPLGRGIVRSMHGPLPAPAPATLELLKGLPVVGIDVEGETVTPTGAALMRALGKTFGAQPPMTIEKIGYGAGQKVFTGQPNLFRVMLGAPDSFGQTEEMLVIETNVDDMNPQFYDHVMDRLFAAGARDVFLAPIQMKKNRPATLLSVIAAPRDREKLAEIIFQETSTIGVRCYPVSRLVLKRELKKVRTRFGEVTVKVVEQPDGSKRMTPEYDELKRLAAAKKLPLKRIYDEVMRRLDQ